MSLYLTDDKSTLVQVITWCRQAASHYLSKHRPRYMSTDSVTRPQWANKLFIIFTTLSFHTTVPLANMPFHSTTIFTSAYLLPLLLAHLPQQKHHLNLLSSVAKHCWRTPYLPFEGSNLVSFSLLVHEDSTPNILWTIHLLTVIIFSCSLHACMCLYYLPTERMQFQMDITNCQ